MLAAGGSAHSMATAARRVNKRGRHADRHRQTNTHAHKHTHAETHTHTPPPPTAQAGAFTARVATAASDTA